MFDMEKTWKGIINLGIVHPMIYPETMHGDGPILETVNQIAKDDFFGAIEVSWIKDPVVRTKVANLLDSAFIDVVYCGGPPILIQKLDLNSLDSNIRYNVVKRVKILVDEAYSLGAKIIAILSGPDVKINKREKAKSYLVHSLKEVCKYAQEKSKDYTLLISLEYFDQEQDKKLLLGPTKEAVEVVDSVSKFYENIGLTVDLSHLPLLNETPKHALTQAKPFLEHVHIGNCLLKDKNNPLYGDKHPRFGLQNGENSLEELKEFLGVLKDIGYFYKKTATRLPVVSFEVKPTEEELSEVLIANSKRVFSEAWSKI
jgi:sugar phosphate isomerase/epimerase